MGGGQRAAGYAHRRYRHHGARKTARLVEPLQTVTWKPSPKTDADEQCEFLYQPEGWAKAHRFLALRYAKSDESADSEMPEQYQLLDTPQYIYRVFGALQKYTNREVIMT
jgi:hypothetical protein